jgi:acetyl esterase/lipase
MIHGGGFVLGDKLQLEPTCRTLADAGFLVVNINYRLAPEHPWPGQLEDCVAALAWVKTNAAGLGGDPASLCVGGGSAGAFLAATLGVREPAGTFDAVLLLNGVFDLETSLRSGFPGVELMLRCLLGSEHPETEVLRAASPIHQLSAGFPPAFVGVGTRDRLYGESLALRDALATHGVSVELREYADSAHGWFNWRWTENARAAHAHMIAWLRGRLRAPARDTA